ncbi:F-box protein SKIP28-like [Macadamia integrifolia]|uniref:F-box protein SKIP28-like n=1 Tax=Macadamia integrifolia TaxID=60698 RepID=UPI001C4F2FEA|nr:F-box protein SKIP28-like [Macadamia integrifolia]XP_042510659.1 F-box protein SKIP28-like [Macadamia integrifolia]
MGSPQFEEKESQEFGSVYDSQPEEVPTHIEEAAEPGEPHEALFFVLAYLQLRERLSIRAACRSLRDAVDNDVLLWLDIFVEPPLGYRLPNDALLKLTSKAHGRLRTLSLKTCIKITDDGLQRVIENNPHINKLYVPACTSLTANGIVTIVKMLTEHNQDLKHLRLHGMYGITKQHFETILSCLKVQKEDQKQNISFLYHKRSFPLVHSDTAPSIDVSICPKCSDVKQVFDCPRDSCKWKKVHPLLECRGCYPCVPRCADCGGCVDLDELDEPACMDILCSECWLRLPKCNLCNRPYCKLHADLGIFLSGGTGFICDACNKSSTRNSDWWSSGLEEFMTVDQYPPIFSDMDGYISYL